MSYSQLGQDLEVINYYNNKDNGFFVEIGASNGIELSNTYLLEKQYKWKGICCEPIPKRFAELVINRPNSICFNEAVYNQSGLTLNFDISNDINNILLMKMDYNDTTTKIKSIKLIKTFYPTGINSNYKEEILIIYK
jgi:hypothetical protein